MMTRQKGMGFLGVLLMLIGLVLAAIIGMKLVPAYIEYYTIKKAINGMTQSGELRGTGVIEVRRAFDRRATVDDIMTIKGADLEITKEGTDVVVSFAYEKRVPLFSNVSVVIDFAGSSGGTTKAVE